MKQHILDKDKGKCIINIYNKEFTQLNKLHMDVLQVIKNN